MRASFGSFDELLVRIVNLRIRSNDRLPQIGLFSIIAEAATNSSSVPKRFPVDAEEAKARRARRVHGSASILPIQTGAMRVAPCETRICA